MLHEHRLATLCLECNADAADQGVIGSSGTCGNGLRCNTLPPFPENEVLWPRPLSLRGRLDVLLVVTGRTFRQPSLAVLKDRTVVSVFVGASLRQWRRAWAEDRRRRGRSLRPTGRGSSRSSQRAGTARLPAPWSRESCRQAMLHPAMLPPRDPSDVAGCFEFDESAGSSGAKSGIREGSSSGTSAGAGTGRGCGAGSSCGSRSRNKIEHDHDGENGRRAGHARPANQRVRCPAGDWSRSGSR